VLLALLLLLVDQEQMQALVVFRYLVRLPRPVVVTGAAGKHLGNTEIMAVLEAEVLVQLGRRFTVEQVILQRHPHPQIQMLRKERTVGLADQFHCLVVVAVALQTLALRQVQVQVELEDLEPP